MANTLEYYNSIASLLNNETDHYYNGALLVDIDSEESTFIQQDVDNIISLSGMGRYVLECGCGGGYFFKRLIQQRPSTRYYGIDASEEQIRCAKEANPEHQARFKVATWDNLPFKDNYFDTIIFLETIGYAEDADRMIAECYRVLKPGGKLFSKHPGSTLEGVMSELDSKVNLQRVFDVTKESMKQADVERYTQYMRDSTAENTYDLNTGKQTHVPEYWTEFNPFKSLSPISEDYGYSDNSLGMLMNVPAFIRKLEQHNFSVPDGYVIPPTDSSLHLRTFFIDEVQDLLVAHKGNNANISLRFRDNTLENFWNVVFERINPNAQLSDVLTPLGKKHMNLINFMFYNVFPMKEDLNDEYVDSASSRQDAAAPCIIFTAIKN